LENQTIFSLGPSRPVSLAVGDINNDNQLDIVVVNYGTLNVAILLGFNNGSFRIQTTYDMGYDSVPYFIDLADFNNDNQLDIAVVNYGTSDLVVLLANNNGTFVIYKYSTGMGSYPTSLAVGDFNNDSQIDIAVTNSGTNNIGIFLGDGHGTFKNTMVYSTGPSSHPQYIVVGDFNTDTKLDIIVANSGNDNIVLFKGNGNGIFSIITTHSTGYSSGPCSIAVGDFDNDKQLDIAVTDNGNNYLSVLTSYAIYPNATQMLYGTGLSSVPISVATGDFNNDAIMDIVVASDGTSSIGICIGLGNGTFEPQHVFYTADFSPPTFVAIGDFNYDNNSDIVVVLSMFNAIVIYFGQGNGTFQDGGIYSTGDNSDPESVAIGYFNNDSYLDIVTANCDSNSAGILFGYSDGTFSNITDYSTGDSSCPMSVAVGDFNNDGILDFAAGNYNSGTISIHLGYGGGTFRSPIIISTGYNYPICIAIGDLNNDNLLDIVFASPDSSTVGVMLAHGHGTFGSITTYSTIYKSSPCFLTVVDINKDHILDIIVADSGSSDVGLFLGYGNGTFNTRIRLSTGNSSSTQSVAYGDFNDDNQPDIVAANAYDADIGVFLIHYDEDFTEETSYLTGSAPHPQSIVIADFNNNDQPDVVIADSGNDNIQIFLDFNKGSFMYIQTYSTGSGSHPQDVTIADFNKDNQLDVAVASTWNDSINIFFGLGNGIFDISTLYSTGSGSFPSSIATGDFNNDSWIDMVVANSGTDNVAVFLGYNYATFTSYYVTFRGLSSSPYHIVAGDFNNDAKLDIAVANKGLDAIDICLGYGNGSFAAMMSYSTGSGSSPNSIAIGDFDNDHQLDIAVANPDTDSIGIFLGYGNGTFATQISYSTGILSYPVSIAIGDMNNDSYLDIIVVNQNINGIGLFLGYGTGIFAEQILYYMPEGSIPVWLAISDFNNDHILDIAIANIGSGNIGILLGYGNATFHNVTTYSIGYQSRPCSIAVGDFNKDSFMDIAVANLNVTDVSVFLGYGDGTFSSERRFSIGSIYIVSISVGDLNNDEILDIIVTVYGAWAIESDHIDILYGLGNGDFLTPQIYNTGIKSLPSSTVICDFNNDGRADFASTNSNQGNVGIMLQDKSTPFATQTIYPTGNGSSPNSVTIGDFNNDDLLDIAVTNSGTNNVGILLGYGNGSFTSQTTYSTGHESAPVSIALADFNNDQQLDIVVANSDADNIGILLGYKNGTFASVQTYPMEQGSQPSSVAVVDFRKDNQMDIIVTAKGSNKVFVFLGSGNGTFLAPKIYSIGYDALPNGIGIADFNNDTRLDVAISCYGTSQAEIFLQTC
jgi:predicted nucleotidyltransferase